MSHVRPRQLPSASPAGRQRSLKPTSKQHAESPRLLHQKAELGDRGCQQEVTFSLSRISSGGGAPFPVSILADQRREEEPV